MPKINHTEHSRTEIIQLPVPGQTIGEDLRVKLYNFTLGPKTTIKDLKKALSDHGQPKSAKNKADLVSRLRAFAENRDSWGGLYRSQPKHKRGDISGARINTRSAQRISALFGTAETQVQYPSKRQGAYHRVVQPQTDRIDQQNEEWANEVLTWSKQLERVPPHEEVDSHAIGDSSHISIDPSSSVNSLSDVELVATTVENGPYQAMAVRRMERKLSVLDEDVRALINVLTINLESSGNHFQAPAANRDLSANHNPESAVLPVHPPAQDLNHSRQLPASLELPLHTPVATTRANSHPGNMITINLGDELFTFDKRSVPDPPVRHFSDDIPALFHEWEYSTALVIDKRGIPLKHWGDIYRQVKRKGVKHTVWDALKMQWGNWKFVVEEKDRLGCEEAFWLEYSNQIGTHLGWQQILDRLKDRRRDADTRDAAAARAYFGDDLAREDTRGVFLYGKGSICTKDAVIAQKWRGLLAQYPDIEAGNRKTQTSHAAPGPSTNGNFARAS